MRGGLPNECSDDDNNNDEDNLDYNDDDDTTTTTTMTTLAVTRTSCQCPSARMPRWRRFGQGRALQSVVEPPTCASRVRQRAIRSHKTRRTLILQPTGFNTIGKATTAAGAATTTTNSNSHVHESDQIDDIPRPPPTHSPTHSHTQPPTPPPPPTHAATLSPTHRHTNKQHMQTPTHLVVALLLSHAWSEGIVHSVAADSLPTRHPHRPHRPALWLRFIHDIDAV